MMNYQRIKTRAAVIELKAKRLKALAAKMEKLELKAERGKTPLTVAQHELFEYEGDKAIRTLFFELRTEIPV